MEERPKKKRYSKEEALAALQRYCVYQDRCHSEVRSKLLDHQVYGDDLEEIIAELISDNFLNEERFAIAFASGKMKIKKWGRQKIKQHLKAKQVSAYCIKKALASLDEEDYFQNCKAVLESKWVTNGTYPEKQKAIRYALTRGYEYELIKEIIGDLG